jgi:hypothetical protein
MTKKKHTPAYSAELRERGVRLFEGTVSIIPAIQLRTKRLRPSLAISLTGCVSGANKLNVMTASALA